MTNAEDVMEVPPEMVAMILDFPCEKVQSHFAVDLFMFPSVTSCALWRRRKECTIPLSVAVMCFACRAVLVRSPSLLSSQQFRRQGYFSDY